MTPEQVEQVESALRAADPSIPPLDPAARAYIAEAVAACPPIEGARARRIGRLLRGSRNWDAIAQPQEQHDDGGDTNGVEAA